MIWLATWIFHVTIATIILTSTCDAMYCNATVEQPPLRLSKSLALLAGDVVNFRTVRSVDTSMTNAHRPYLLPVSHICRDTTMVLDS
jgi:hypothetical protein